MNHSRRLVTLVGHILPRASLPMSSAVTMVPTASLSSSASHVPAVSHFPSPMFALPRALPDGSVAMAHLDYTVEPAPAAGAPPGVPVMNITHTLVPEAFRGQGVAKILVDAACAHARAHGMKVRPTCSYVSDTYFVKAGKNNADLCVEGHTKVE